MVISTMKCVEEFNSRAPYWSKTSISGMAMGNLLMKARSLRIPTRILATVPMILTTDHSHVFTPQS